MIIAKKPTSIETYKEMGIMVEYRVIRVNKVRAATCRSKKENKNQIKNAKGKAKRKHTEASIYYHKSVARVEFCWHTFIKT